VQQAAIAKRLLPTPRHGYIQKIEVANWDGYIRVTELDGVPVELFIVISKEGSTMSGLLRALGKTVSIGLRCGVPLGYYIKTLRDMRFEPQGHGGFGDTRGEYTSLVDCIARALEDRYGTANGRDT